MEQKTAELNRRLIGVWVTLFPLPDLKIHNSTAKRGVRVGLGGHPSYISVWRYNMFVYRDAKPAA